ncbi:MAG: chemotaxis protein CheA [Gammaproteobacteria bacterium]|nr:chemotaxis protein CheA [Gammaproteobacteria bacterium]
MSIDLSQFHAVFFEESFEGLDVMENALLELQPENPDSELINSIFRSAHSIKGGSGTFGFISISEFTHILETLLDKIREGEEQLDVDSVELFLQSVDCMRTMLEALQAETEPDTTRADQLAIMFQSILTGASAAEAKGLDVPATGASPVIQESVLPGSDSIPDSLAGFHIEFTPEADMLKGGNDPVRMMRELATLGELTSTPDTGALPTLRDMQPDVVYLNWCMDLHGDMPLEDVQEVFEWVEGECDLSISRLGGGADSAPEVMPSNVAEAVDHAPDGTSTAATKTKADEQESAKPIPDAPKTASPAKPAPAPAARAGKAESSSIRVGIDKVDSLINLVGELVITQSMLGQMGGSGEVITDDHIGNLREGLVQLEQNTRELQDSVMRIRMLPISFAFNRFPRMVRDLSLQLGKKVRLELRGEQTELDKTVMEKINDPLVHLVRNAMDHGIESPNVRADQGKDETGTIVLNAFHQGGNIIIEMIDDGGGIDADKLVAKARANGIVGDNEQLNQEQKLDLLFAPGLSTVEQVSDLSGRGVGMDVVRRNIQELNGSVDIDTELGKGTTFRIRLPLTLAILDGQLVTVAGQTYIFPLMSISESLQIDEKLVNNVAGGGDVYNLRDEYIPILSLDSIFGLRTEPLSYDQSLLVVVEAEGMKVSVVVDDLMAQQQVVIKSLEDNYTRVPGVSGATILGDGTVAMILDVAGLIGLAGNQKTMAAGEIAGSAA